MFTSARQSLAVAAFGTLLTLVVFTMPLATLTVTADSLAAGVAGRTWILSSMSIGLAVALLSSGTIADDYGRRRTFILGMLLLALGSVACAVVPSAGLFIASRVVQGVGGAAVTSSSLGILAHAYPAGPARAKASGVWGASVGAGIAIGPLLSAGLESMSSWHISYWVTAATAVSLAAAARSVVPESRSPQSHRVDAVGTVVLALGMASVLAALVELRQGWTQPIVLTLGGIGLVLLLMFVAVESRTASPMLDLGLFRHRPFVAATTAAFATGMGVIALCSFMPGFLTVALGMSPFDTALLLLVWSATSVAAALTARRLPAWIPGRVELGVGLISVAIGQVALLGVNEGSTWARFVPGLLVAGLANGLVNAALGREAVASVPPGRASMGSGANNTARYVGSAVGVTIVAVIAAQAGVGSAAYLESWNVIVLVTAAFSALGGLAVLTCVPAKVPEKVSIDV